LRVTNDILLALDSGSCVVLVLLDLSADHNIVLEWLEYMVGVKATVLQWFASYLKKMTFSVNLGNCSSLSAPVLFGVPQGSILGPLLFSLLQYMLPLALIFQKYNILNHCYADNSQLYLPVRLDTNASIHVLLE